MNFVEGGRRLYAMVGPEGETHWALADYTSITPITNFAHSDAFCDADGNINRDLPRSDWDVSFSREAENQTLVSINIKHKELADLEKILEMGFKEGFTAALENLDDYFEAQAK